MRSPRALAVSITDDSLVVDLVDGRTVSVPLAWYPRLVHGTPEERSEFSLIGDGTGIHWPRLDEDISVEGSSRAFHPASLSIPSKGGSASAGVPANSAMEPSRHVARHDQVPAARRFHPRERGRHGKVHTPALQTGVFGHGGRIPHRRLEGGGLPIPEPSSEAEVVEIGPPNSRGVTRTPVASRRGVAGAPRR